MHPVEPYFTGRQASIGVDVPETSGCSALANLINAVGEYLEPKIVLTCPVFKGIVRNPAFLITPPLLVFRLAF